MSVNAVYCDMVEFYVRLQMTTFLTSRGKKWRRVGAKYKKSCNCLGFFLVLWENGLYGFKAVQKYVIDAGEKDIEA